MTSCLGVPVLRGNGALRRRKHCVNSDRSTSRPPERLSHVILHLVADRGSTGLCRKHPHAGLRRLGLTDAVLGAPQPKPVRSVFCRMPFRILVVAALLRMRHHVEHFFGDVVLREAGLQLGVMDEGDDVAQFFAGEFDL